MPENRLNAQGRLRRPGSETGWSELTLPLRSSAGPAAGGSTATTLREGLGSPARPMPPCGLHRRTRLPGGTLVAGRYRVAAALGRGGMGEVYRAHDLKLNQAVALKFLTPARAAFPAERAGLCREVRLARGISHPNVCRVFDLVEADSCCFLVMESIDGEDLERLLARRGRLQVEEAVAIARQLAAGLTAIHDGGLVHCDIKPANVMIDRRSRVRIIDFGVAVKAGEPSDGRRAGTLAYMAPEQRSWHAVSARTDLYSLGLVLYEMVAGRPAGFSEAGPALAEGGLPCLEARIGAILARCLAPDPARRPASALEVEAVLAGGSGVQPLATAASPLFFLSPTTPST